MASLFDTFKEAAKAAAKGAADSAFAPKAATPAQATQSAAISAIPSGIDTPTESGLPSWALPAAAAGAVLLLVLRK